MIFDYTSSKELAKSLGLKHKDILNLIETGKIKGTKIGNTYIIYKKDFDLFYQESNTTESHKGMIFLTKKVLNTDSFENEEYSYAGLSNSTYLFIHSLTPNCYLKLEQESVLDTWMEKIPVGSKVIITKDGNYIAINKIQ